MTTTAPPVTPPAVRLTARDRFGEAVRRFSALTAAGALAGLVVGGVGGRLAMLLLAVLNPEAAGTVSDDGFVMGRFDVVNTLNLLAAGTGLGLLGAAFYAVLRTLMIGPRWFQVLSIAGGPAIVVGEMLVHTDGVDFRLLQPAALGIALFVLLPGLYAAVLTLLAERWLRPGSWSSRADLRRVAGVLVVWLVVFPLLPVVAVLTAGWWAREAARSTAAGARVLAWTAWPWIVRVLLAALFVRGAVVLAGEVAVLT